MSNEHRRQHVFSVECRWNCTEPGFEVLPRITKIRPFPFCHFSFLSVLFHDLIAFKPAIPKFEFVICKFGISLSESGIHKS